jgi:hypothetical protein
MSIGNAYPTLISVPIRPSSADVLDTSALYGVASAGYGQNEMSYEKRQG